MSVDWKGGPPHAWGPNGPDADAAFPEPPVYEWPDIYHPTQYGEEFKGNKPLMIDGPAGPVHPCPPRDFARHDGCGCGPVPIEPRGVPCSVVHMMSDYIDTLSKYMSATTYQDQCACVDQMKDITRKMEKALKDFDKEVRALGKAVSDINQKLVYYTGRFIAVVADLERNMLRQDELEAAFKELTAHVAELERLIANLGLLIVHYEFDGDTLTRTTDADVIATSALRGDPILCTINDTSEEDPVTFAGVMMVETGEVKITLAGHVFRPVYDGLGGYELSTDVVIADEIDCVDNTWVGADEYPTVDEVELKTGATYALSISGQTLTLTGSDGSASSVTLPDLNTTYALSISGMTVTLTGSDSSTSSVTIPDTPEATEADIDAIFA